jgi:hypothetical protein
MLRGSAGADGEGVAGISAPEGERHDVWPVTARKSAAERDGGLAERGDVGSTEWDDDGAAEREVNGSPDRDGGPTGQGDDGPTDRGDGDPAERGAGRRSDAVDDGGVDRRPCVGSDGALRTVADRGSVTVEYAILLIAVAGFAGLLLVILSGDEVRGMLVDLVHRALQL